MKRGTKVIVSGSESFSGTVLAVFEHSIVIEVAPGVSTTLMRNFAGKDPLQWRSAGLPVVVREKPDLEEFRKLLWALERNTRNL
jgi:preprotein translocase subunit YajC